MNSSVAGLIGAQQPRIELVPEHVSSAAIEAIDLARQAGLVLDPWQELVLAGSLGERADGNWAAKNVGLVVPRQNGKDAILEARELAGLFLLGERLIVHTAHLFDTCLEHFQRLWFLIENTPDLERRVKSVWTANGKEGITLKNGQRIRFRTRTKGGGRGFSGDCIILNEAMYVPETAMGALAPTLSARKNPQMWFVGSPVDQTVHENGMVLARLRDQALKRKRGLAYFEWSLDARTPADVDAVTAGNVDAWAAANPGFGIRIPAENIMSERAIMDPRTFAVERLGVGDWPSLEAAESVISKEAWFALVDVGSEAVAPLALAFDVPPDRSSAVLAVVGSRPDGRKHLEIVAQDRGTGWVVAKVKDLVEKHRPVGVFCDSIGPASSLIPDLERENVVVTPLNGGEHAKGCGMLVDLVEQGQIRHLGTSELAKAVAGAVKRPLLESWAWSRKNSGVDIAPLVACTLALYGHSTTAGLPEPFFAFA